MRGYFQQTRRRRLAARSYRNPYFHREPKPSKWKFIVLGAFAATLAAVSILLAAPRFSLQSVEISGTELLAPKEISARASEYLQKRRWLFFKNSNLFLFRPEGLVEALETQYVFESLSVVKEGKAIRVNVREKQSELVWMTPDQTYIIDREGIILRMLSPEEQEARKSGIDPFAKLLKCRSLQKQTLTIGMSALNPTEVERLFFFRRELGQLGIIMKEIQIDRTSGSWMIAKTEGGFEILFDPAAPPEEQMANLSAVFRQLTKDPSALQYIDLRFGNHVYYK